MAPSDYYHPPVAIKQQTFDRLTSAGYPASEEVVDTKPMQVVRVPRELFEKERQRMRSGRPPRR